MALAPAERKELLGFGGLKDIADAAELTEGHVSQVNGEKRDDAAVEALIAARIRERHPKEQGHSCKQCRDLDLAPTNIWPAKDADVPPPRTAKKRATA